MSEEMAKAAAEEKAIEDPKVAAKLQAENNEFEEKIVSTAQKKAKDIQNA